MPSGARAGLDSPSVQPKASVTGKKCSHNTRVPAGNQQPTASQGAGQMWSLGTAHTGQSSRTRGAIQLVIAALIGGAIVTGAPGPALAQTSPVLNPNSQLLPISRDEVGDEEIPGWSLAKFPPQPYMREIYWQQPSETPAFFRDALLQTVGRTYYFTKDNFNGTRSQAWTGGGWIAFRSGLIGNLLGMHAAVYTSQKLYAPDGEGGTRLLTQEQDPINVLGQIYGRMQIFDQEVRGGRMLVDTPLINPQDNRMVPNTFEGAQLVSLPDKERSYDYAIGYLWTIKPRDSNDFIPMSDQLAGADVVDRAVPFGMVRWRPLPGLSTVFMDYYVDDFVNTGFAQAEYSFQPSKQHPTWKFGVNVIDQRTVGSNLLTGVPFETYQASAKVQMDYAGWTLFAAGSVTGPESNLFSPFGSKPNYTDMQQISFDNANEKAIGGSVAYDFGYAFGQYGLTGLSVGAWYTSGWDAISPVTGFSIADRRELDLWIQYRPNDGPLKGLRVKTQYSTVWQDGNVRDTQPEFRFIVDYTVLFRPPPVISTRG
jgi:outer membrane porin, OprD family